MSFWDDIKKQVNKLPGAGEVNKIGGDISSWVGSQFPFNEREQTFEKRVADPLGTIFGHGPGTGWLGTQWPFDIGAPSKKKKDPQQTGPPTDTQPTATQQPTQPSADDVFTAGLGMFFSQYLAPMMQQINSQNTGLINQWGDTMNKELAQPLPAGVAAIMKPWMAQNAQTMQLMNNAAAMQTAWQVPYNTMMNQVGKEGEGLQAMAQAIPQAAAAQMIANQNPQAMAQMYANMGLANTPMGAAGIAMLNSPSMLSSLLGQQGKGTSAATPSAVQVLPIPQQQAASLGVQQSPALQNTNYAQQLAQAMMAANQPTAAGAMQQAQAGTIP